MLPEVLLPGPSVLAEVFNWYCPKAARASRVVGDHAVRQAVLKFVEVRSRWYKTWLPNPIMDPLSDLVAFVPVEDVYVDVLASDGDVEERYM
ncbi:MAG: hypothetical protein WCP21_20050, partial [Armatimonadota bacterium]